MEFAKRQTFSTADHSIFAGLYQLAPMVLNALAVKPETIIKWHRAGFRFVLVLEFAVPGVAGQLYRRRSAR